MTSSRKTQTAHLRAVCFTCLQDIAGNRGAIHVPYADIHTRADADREYKRQRTEEPSLVVDMAALFSLPPLAQWQVHCDTCNPHKGSHGGLCADCYWIGINRCRTWPQLITFTTHLADKTWFKATNWMSFIETIARGTSDVGLVADAADLAVA